MSFDHDVLTRISQHFESKNMKRTLKRFNLLGTVILGGVNMTGGTSGGYGQASSTKSGRGKSRATEKMKYFP